jgi:hypothetical protein
MQNKAMCEKAVSMILEKIEVLNVEIAEEKHRKRTAQMLEFNASYEQIGRDIKSMAALRDWLKELIVEDSAPRIFNTKKPHFDDVNYGTITVSNPADRKDET